MRLLTLVLVALLLAPSTALGQGTSNTLPDPIAGADLSAYARRLGLSEQQRLAIDASHETYLAAFAVLREREIEKFLEESNTLMRSFWSTPDTRGMRSALRTYERLLGRIKSLDEQLFDEVQSLLSESQVELMPLVRQHRERVRVRSGLARIATFQNPAARTDLSELIAGVDLAPTERETVEPVVNDYERQLTAATRKISSDARRMMLNVADRLAEQAAAAEPGQRRNWRAFGEIWRDESKPVTETAADLADLNWRSLRTMGPLLTTEHAVDLRRAYLERAYGELKATGTKALDRYDSALRRGLDESLRESVTAARDEYRARHDRVVDEMVEVIRKKRREGRTGGFGNWGQRESAEETSQLEALRAQRTAVLEEAARVLIGLLGEERVAKLDEAPSSSSEAAPAAAAGAAGAGTAAGAASAAPHLLGTKPPPDPAAGFAGPDPYLPAAIAADELTWYAALASMDSGDVAVLESLHDGYLEQWEDSTSSAVAQVLDGAKRIAPRRRRGNDGQAEVTADDVERVFDLRRRALNTMRALDDAFFADIEIAILGGDDDEQVLRLRHARDRIVYRHATASAAPMGRWRGSVRSRDQREAGLDLALLVGTGLLDEDGRVAAARELADYERDRAEMLRDRYDQRLDQDKTSARLRLEFFGSGRDGGSQWTAYNTALTKATASTTQRINALDTRLAELNRAGLQRLAGGLAPGDAERVRTRFRASLHPEVYDDSRAVEPAFLAVLRLADLSDEQRVGVGEIFAEYRGAYGSLCGSMADVLDADEDVASGANRWQRRAERRNAFEKLRFQREELNDKTLRRLRAALTEEQQQRLGLGADS
ncbi:MAG: hypothetical protein ACYTGP_05635 [Planctomycetota bacterium]